MAQFWLNSAQVCAIILRRLLLYRYARIMERTGKLSDVSTDDWNEQTRPAWRHSIWVGVWDPWPVIRRPHLWWKCMRDGWCLDVMHKAFDKGLMEYGMMTAGKKAASAAPAAPAAA